MPVTSTLRLCWIVVATLLSAPLAHATHYQLFVLTGQSNSLGTTNAGEADFSPGNDPADAHIPFFWSNRVDTNTLIGDSGGAFQILQSQQGGVYAGSATHWGPEINFGRTLYRAGVRNFGIIKASRGGGGNSLWSKQATDHHMYTHVVNTVNAAVTNLTGKGHTYEIVGLLYLQGESDSSTEANIADTRIRELTDNLRADLPNADNLHCIIGGIAAAGTTRDVVRSKQATAGTANAHIDFFPNLDLQGWTAADNLHFNKAAKLRIGERYAQACFNAGLVSRHYGKLVFIGDSITQGGNGDHPSYRYTIFKHLANKAVSINPITGYQFTGSVKGPQTTPTLTTPNVNGQAFENVHDGHYGWRVSWQIGRLRLPRERRSNNRGEGTLLNWTTQANATFNTTSAQYAVSNSDGIVSYPDLTATGTGNTGTTYTPDMVSIMIGINDLGDNNNAANQVVADIGTMIDQLRAANPNVRIHLNRLLYTNQAQAMKDAVDAVNGQLQGLADAKNTASSSSPVWIIDASTGFDPVTMTYDNVHPNASGEAYVGDRIAAALGIIETPMAQVAQSTEPPHLESGSASFNHRFEGNEIWNGTAMTNGWNATGILMNTLVPDAQNALSDLKTTHPSTDGRWLEGTNSGWANGRAGDWTFEFRLKFNANANGYMVWLGTGNQRILVEIYGNCTQDNGANAFNVAHDNLDGNFHVFRIAHASATGKYHVWRDGMRLTPVSGAPYDGGSDGRLIMGDYTSGTFGNHFDVTIDHVRYDFSAAFLPTGADADNDAMPDSWEYAHFGTIDGANAGTDDDGDGKSNADEYAANTDPHNRNSALKIDSVSKTFGNTATITLPATSPQRYYTLYKSTDLGMANPWTAIAGPSVGTDGDLTLQDANAGIVGFYRVIVSQ